MEIDKSSLVVSKAGRDQGQLFYVIDADEQYVYLARRQEPASWRSQSAKSASMLTQLPRTESRIAEKIRNGEKVLNSELRKNWPASAKKKVKTKGVN